MQRIRPLAVLAFVPLLAACPSADSTAPNSCTGPLPYASGTTLTGVMGSGGNYCKGPDGSHGMLYNFTVANGAGMNITMVTSGFAPHIGVYTTANKAIARSNAGNMPAYLPAGTYTLFIGNNSGADGSFTLTSPPFVHTGCAGDVVTTKGASISGTLAASDCGAPVKDHMFHILGLTAGTVVSVTYTVDRMMGFNLVGGCTVNKEVPAAGSGVVSCTTTGSEVGLNIESRTTNNGNTNLPVNYTVTIN